MCARTHAHAASHVFLDQGQGSNRGLDDLQRVTSSGYCLVPFLSSAGTINPETPRQLLLLRFYLLETTKPNKLRKWQEVGKGRKFMAQKEKVKRMP